jgi:parvulin-like peptidyl-prolyl isomerase
MRKRGFTIGLTDSRLIFAASFLAVLLVASAPLAAADGAAETTFDRPAAVVNGETITVRMVEEQIERFADTLGADSPRADFRQMLMTLINRRLLVQTGEQEISEAAKARLAALAEKRATGGWDPHRIKEPDDKDSRTIYEDYLIQAYLDRKVYQPVQVSPGEVRAYYAQNIDAFTLPETLTIRQVLVREWERSSEEAKAIVAQAAAEIAGGASFEEVALKVSEGPYASEGGLWPAKTMAELIEPVAEAAAALPVGQVSEPFHSPLGWHIVKVEAHELARMVPFSDAQEKIHEMLASARRSDARERLMARLRSGAVIQILLAPDDAGISDAPAQGKS